MTIVKMSFKHSIVFALLAFVAVQSVTAAATGKTFDVREVQEATPRLIGRLIELAKQAIERLIGIVRSAIAAAVNTLRALLQGIIDLAQSLIDHAIQSIKDEIQRIRDLIQQIAQQAAELGVDIGECLVETEPELEAIPTNIIANLVQCVTDEVDRAKAIVEGAINDVNDILNTVLTLPSELEECVNGRRPVTCILRLTADVTEAIASIPIVISTRVAQAVHLVATVERDLRNCAIRAVAQATADATVVLVHVAECVADRITADDGANLLTHIKA